MATLIEESLAAQSLPQSDLLVEVYCYEKEFRNPQDFVALTRLAVQWNDRLDGYPWWHRPCFDVHINEDQIPHLRATVTYCDVRDCWHLVGLFLNENDTSIVVKFWEDGDLLLTEAAYHLPDWIHTQSDDEVEYCRNRCWIRNGQVILIPPPNECSTISQALLAVTRNRFEVVAVEFQKAIQSRLSSLVSLYQRTAVAVPRQVAFLLQTLPHIGNEAAAVFIEKALAHAPRLSVDKVDWVWTTCSLGRTQYAALRTAVSRTWPDSEHVPLRTPELNRLLRQAANDATPHLRHGVALGVRLVAGLEYLVSASPPLVELPLLGRWPALLAQTGTDPSWFLDAYQAGPSHSTVDLDSFLKLDKQCETIKNKHSSIRSILNKGVGQSGWDGLPRRSDLDEDESWMTVSDDSGLNLNENVIQHQVESFMQSASNYDGVQMEERPCVNPVIFLNILQATLKANVRKDMEFLDRLPDPYFSAQDYELAEEDGGNDDDDDTITMKDVMAVMDQQLGREDNDDIATHWRQSLEENAGGFGPVQTILRGLP